MKQTGKQWLTLFWGASKSLQMVTAAMKLKEATVRTGHGIIDWFQIEKELHQGCILSPCLFNLYAGYIMQNAGLGETPP